MKKQIKLFGLLFAAVLMYTGCASTSGNTNSKLKEPEKNYDCVLQVINMSSHPIEVWPEITTGSDLPTIYDRETVFEGEAFNFYFNSSDIIKNFENWKQTKKKDLKLTEAWLIFGYKQLDTGVENWTSGYSLSNLENSISSMYIRDDIEKRESGRTSLLSETTVTTDFHYIFKNNLNKPVFVRNYLYDTDNNLLAGSETKLIKPGKEYKYNYSLSALKKQYPGCKLSVHYYDVNDDGCSGWNRSVNSIKDDIVFTINALNDPNGNTLTSLLDTTSDDWKKSEWTSYGDTYFTPKEGGKTVKFTQKSDSSGLIRYTNYATDKCRGFEAEVVRYSGDEVGSLGYGFTFNEDLEKRTGYMVVITSIGLYWLYEISPKGLIPITSSERNGKKYDYDLSFSINNEFGEKNKITVVNSENDIKVYFNDYLEYVIKNAKYLSGNTRLVASHNGNKDDVTEIDFEYLKFQK